MSYPNISTIIERLPKSLMRNEGPRNKALETMESGFGGRLSVSTMDHMFGDIFQVFFCQDRDSTLDNLPSPTSKDLFMSPM